MKKISRLILTAIITTCLCGASLAQDKGLLKQNHPDRYVVKKGDTLWDIAGMFLHQPWLWPEIWQANPHIVNPHLIYPGDELELVYVDGKPQLRRASGSARASGTAKLSPRIRTTTLEAAIPAIPVDAITPFLSRPYVVGLGDFQTAPYVVAFADEHIVAGAGQRVYVRSIMSDNNVKFDIVRPGDAYKDAETQEILGYEGLLIGTAELQRTGDPATLMITTAGQEVLVGDRLIPAARERGTGDFYPHAPEQLVTGSIISVMNGVSQIGQYNIVVLDRGNHDGLAPGMVLQVDHKGETVRDHVAKTHASFSNFTGKETVVLPDERAGLLMVFRSFDRVSFGIIMNAERAIHVNDRVHNP